MVKFEEMLKIIFNKKLMKIALIILICFIITYKLSSDIITYFQIDGYETVTQDADGNTKYGFIHNGKEYVESDVINNYSVDNNFNIYTDDTLINKKDKVYFHYGACIGMDGCVYGFEHDPFKKIYITGDPGQDTSIDETTFVQKGFKYPNLFIDPVYKIELSYGSGNIIIIVNPDKDYEKSYEKTNDFINELKTNGTIKNSMSKYGYDNTSNCDVYVDYDFVPLSELIGKYTKYGFEFTERYQKLNKNNTVN